MRQLNSLDAAFLAVESPRQPEHHGIFFVLEPRAGAVPLGLDAIRAHIAARVELIPPLRWRLRRVPLGIDYPYWIEDPQIDYDYHVREVALPAPATDEKLAELVSWLAGRPLNLARQLWMAYLIHGLPEGRVGLLMVVHHAAVDGAGVMDVMYALTDTDPSGRELAAPAVAPPAREPGSLEMLGRGLAGVARYWRRTPSVLRTARHSRDAVDALRGRSASEPRPRAPLLSFNRRPSADRRWVFGDLPLELLLDAKRAHGCTLNDVVLSVCAGAVRRWLIEHGELPQMPLLVRVPVSTRTAEKQGSFGNQLGVITAPFFTDEPDPMRRLQLTHEALGVRKERLESVPATLPQDLLGLVPAPLCRPFARIASVLAHSLRPAVNVGVANVPGPREQRYLLGAPMSGFYSVNLTPDGPGFVFFSVGTTCNFTAVADRELVPDLWRMIGWLREEVAALAAPVSRPARVAEA